MKVFEDIVVTIDGEKVSLFEALTYYQKHTKSAHNTELDKLRARRHKECFSVVDRGKLWYNDLTSDQFAELKRWRQEWLDVTETKVIPVAPAWINDKLEGEEIL